METVGFCTIKKGATSGIGYKLETFIGQDCSVLEFATDGGVLVMNKEGTAIATFNKEDVLRQFRCREFAGVICPPGLHYLEVALYAGKVLCREGGYNPLLKNMVISASLMMNEFTDDFLFQQPQSQNREDQVT